MQMLSWKRAAPICKFYHGKGAAPICKCYHGKGQIQYINVIIENSSSNM